MGKLKKQPAARQEVEEPTAFVNYYECPRCGHEWEDEDEAQPDDDCPECGCRHVSPYHSEAAE